MTARIPRAFRWISCVTVLLFRTSLGHAQAPPAVTVLASNGQLADGYIFISPTDSTKNGVSGGPLIVDNQGRPVWFSALPNGSIASDFRVQSYQGQPVLTWSQGTGFQNTQPGATTDYILDTSYRVVATVQAGNGLNADQHDFVLTPENTALIVISNLITADLSSVGGSPNASALEGVVQEVDVATGKVLFEWHSFPAVALDESYAEVPTTPQAIFDYFHINSVSLDTDGNLLVSSRHTWTVYKIDRNSGAILWRLGGKKSDFSLGEGLPFAWQHDVEAVDATTLRIFDNESNGTPVLPYSRVLWVTHDDVNKTAKVIKVLQHPAAISVAAEGNAQSLDNGDTFVGWGITGRYSEFDVNGQLLYDAALPQGLNTYRAYRFAWIGKPEGAPDVQVYDNGDGSLTVHAIWNGATQIAQWSIMAGEGGKTPQTIATADWNGLDTPINVQGEYDSVQVLALDKNGAILGTSDIATGPFPAAAPAISTEPEAQWITPGDTVAFHIIASGTDPLQYQWLKDGIPLTDGTGPLGTIVGSQSPTILIESATVLAAGNLTCQVSNVAGKISSAAASLNVSPSDNAGHLVNVSCRSTVLAGDALQIVGFVVEGSSGTTTEPMLIRCSGPALANFGITQVLPHPQLSLFDTAQLPSTLIDSNEGWGGNPKIAEAISAAGAFNWPDANSADAALVETLGSGPYTATIADGLGETGVALTEIFDTSPATSFDPSQPHLVNVSARAHVGTGEDMLIAGFVIGGTTSRTLLIRAWGPSLSAFGISDALAQPQLQLRALSASSNSSTSIATNVKWAGDREVQEAITRVGADGWDPSSSDSAMVLTLPPGAYTATVNGADGGEGVSLVEVFDVP